MDEPKKEILNKWVNDNSDSIEIGTPAKGGCMKIYGNADKPEEFLKKINNMQIVREHAQKATGY